MWPDVVDKQIVDDFKKEVGQFPSDLKQMLSDYGYMKIGDNQGLKESIEEIRVVIGIFFELIKAVEIIERLADVADGVREGHHIDYPYSFVTLKLDKQGRLTFDIDPFLKELEGIEVWRVRRCNVCSRVFWAGRADQVCCTSKCAQVRRTRLWRERYQKNYKLQRNGLSPLESIGEAQRKSNKPQMAVPKKKKRRSE